MPIRIIKDSVIIPKIYRSHFVNFIVDCAAISDKLTLTGYVATNIDNNTRTRIDYSFECEDRDSAETVLEKIKEGERIYNNY